MKIGKIIIGLTALLFLGVAGFLLFADIPIAQTDISRDIPHDRFAKE